MLTSPASACLLQPPTASPSCLRPPRPLPPRRKRRRPVRPRASSRCVRVACRAPRLPALSLSQLLKGPSVLMLSSRSARGPRLPADRRRERGCRPAELRHRLPRCVVACPTAVGLSRDQGRLPRQVLGRTGCTSPVWRGRVGGERGCDGRRAARSVATTLVEAAGIQGQSGLVRGRRRRTV